MSVQNPQSQNNRPLRLPSVSEEPTSSTNLTCSISPIHAEVSPIHSDNVDNHKSSTAVESDSPIAPVELDLELNVPDVPVIPTVPAILEAIIEADEDTSDSFEKSLEAHINSQPPPLDWDQAVFVKKMTMRPPTLRMSHILQTDHDDYG